ncbi:hypothetical protein DFQ26_007122 [Actinomortierella ambigua]|nr:hypothetical protein DFQ26_007122 [Actinomortierella ambigua]
MAARPATANFSTTAAATANAFRQKFNIARHDIAATFPSFRLACNVYSRKDIPSPSLQNSEAEGTSPALVFAHANGFCKEMWEPVIARVDRRWTEREIYAYDCYNEGDSAVLNKDLLENRCNWLTYAQDVLALVDHFKLTKPVGIGHRIIAETLRPGTFGAIVAVDPTMYPKEVNLLVPVEDHPLASLTIRRRDQWKDRDEARESFLKKSLFRAWHPEALDLYLQFGLLDNLDKDGRPGVTLKCPKIQEAMAFAHEGTGLHDAFENLPQLNIPVHFLFGATSDINPSDLVEMKLQRTKYATHEIVKGGHLFPFEEPLDTARDITKFLEMYTEAKGPSVDTPTKARL